MDAEGRKGDPPIAQVDMRRKVIAAILVAALSLAICLVAQAEDESPIKCTIEVSSSKLTGPSPVDVTISISNTSEDEIPVTLKAPDRKNVADFGKDGEATLAAGDTKTWKGTWNVTDQQLENGEIYFYLYYEYTDEYGQVAEMGMNIIQKISKEGTAVDLSITRSVSPTTAREGQTVTILYDITNTGNVQLNKINVKENSSISKKTGSMEKLEPGQRAQIKFEVKMAKKDLTSGATVTYTPEGEKKSQKKTVEDLKIVYGEPKMTAKLTASAKGVIQGGTFVLTLQLENESKTVEYTDLRVTDPQLGELFSNQTLGAKGSATGKLTLTKELTLAETTTYQFTITAIDNATNEITLTSDSITVTAVDPNKVVHLTLNATSDRVEVYELPGLVRFAIELTNDSDVDATDVTLYHGTTKLSTIASLPAGQTRLFHRDAAISQAGKYQFTASLTDALGDTKSFTSNELQIIYSIPTPAPATPLPAYMQTAEPTFQPATYPSISDPSIGKSFKSIWNIGLYMAIAAGVLLVGCLALLLIAAKKRMDRKRASDAAYDHLERARRRDYVAPAEQEGVSAKVLGRDDQAPATTDSADADTLDIDGEELPHVKYARNAVERQQKTDELQDDASYLDYGEDDVLTGGYDEDSSMLYEPEQSVMDDRMSYARPAASSEDLMDEALEQDDSDDTAYAPPADYNPYARPVSMGDSPSEPLSQADAQGDTGRRHRTRTERHAPEDNEA